VMEDETPPTQSAGTADATYRVGIYISWELREMLGWVARRSTMIAGWTVEHLSGSGRSVAVDE